MEPAGEVLEGRVLDPPGSGMSCNADHWPAFRRVYLGEAVWHDEAARLEERGRLDAGPCECPECSLPD